MKRKLAKSNLTFGNFQSKVASRIFFFFLRQKLLGPVKRLDRMVKNLPPMRETQGQSLGQEDALEKGMLPTPVFLSGKNSWTEDPGAKSWTQLSD